MRDFNGLEKGNILMRRNKMTLSFGAKSYVETPRGKSLFLSICFSITTLLLAAALPAAAVAGIRLTIDEGVPDNIRTTFKRGVTEGERFYKDNFGVTLKKDVEIVLAKDKDSFAKALLRLGCDKTIEQAKKHAAKAGGSTCPKGIAMAQSKNLDFLIGVTMHELTHKYQFQEAPDDRSGDIWWLVEGGATATGCYIKDKIGVLSLQNSYKDYLGELKGKRHPLLKDVRKHGDHNKAYQDKYPGGTYNTETLAALELARRKGITSLYQYFLNLKKNKDSAKVFEMTFGIKLDRFEKEFESWLTQQLAQKK